MLFPPDLLPDLPAMERGAKAYVHTGKIVTRDEERAAAIAQAYVETGSILAVCRRFHVSPNTVKTVMRIFEDAGKLDDLKQRVSRNLGLVIELAGERLVEKLEADKIPANVLPIVLGVAVEKKALVDGEATSRLALAATRPLTVDDLSAYVQMQQARKGAIDVESTATTQKGQQ